MRGVFGFVVATSLGLGLGVAQAATVNILAAENFYGNVAEQVGGPEVDVANILTNPDQDPHLFEVSASTARRVGNAEVVIFNGVGAVIAGLLASRPTGGQTFSSCAGVAPSPSAVHLSHGRASTLDLNLNMKRSSSLERKSQREALSGFQRLLQSFQHDMGTARFQNRQRTTWSNLDRRDWVHPVDSVLDGKNMQCHLACNRRSSRDKLIGLRAVIADAHVCSTIREVITSRRQSPGMLNLN